MDEFGQFDMIVRHRGEDAGVVVELRGELDLYGAEMFCDRVRDLIDGGAAAVEIDGSGLSFVDSSGFKALLDVRHDAQQRGVAFSLVSASERLRWVIDLTGAHHLLPLAG